MGWIGSRRLAPPRPARVPGHVPCPGRGHKVAAVTAAAPAGSWPSEAGRGRPGQAHHARPSDIYKMARPGRADQATVHQPPPTRQTARREGSPRETERRGGLERRDCGARPAPLAVTSRTYSAHVGSALPLRPAKFNLPRLRRGGPSRDVGRGPLYWGHVTSPTGETLAARLLQRTSAVGHGGLSLGPGGGATTPEIIRSRSVLPVRREVGVQLCGSERGFVE